MMKKITGYAKCPICNGTGEHTTKASDIEIERIRNLNEVHQSIIMSIGAPLLPKLAKVPEPEYQTCTKCKGEMVLPIYEGER